MYIYIHTHIYMYEYMGFPGGTSGKEPACQFGKFQRYGFRTTIP